MSYTDTPGIVTSDNLDLFKRQETLEFVDTRTFEQMDFLDAVVPRNISILDPRFQMPKQSVLPVFRIDEGQTVVRQKMGFYDTGTSLYGYRGAVEISETAKVRGDYDMQWQFSMEGVANGMTAARDTEILSALYTGAGNSVDADTTWDDEGGKNIIGDVAAAVRKIFKNKQTNITSAELSNMIIYYPAHLMMDVDIPEMFQDNGTSGGNMGYLIPNASQADYLRGKRFALKPTTRLNEETFALGVIRSPKTAVHFSYTGPEMPRIKEYENIEEGTSGYMLSQWFRTHIHGQSYGVSTSDRVFIINGVASA